MTKLPDIEALLSECRFEATRSSGSGGQNVNKVSTKVVLVFDITESRVLNEEQKEIFQSELHTRISKYHVFRISSGRERTQLANRKLVIENFIKLVKKAFQTEEERIATKPTKGSKVKRLEDKKAISGRKSERLQKWDNEDDR